MSFSVFFIQIGTLINSATCCFFLGFLWFGDHFIFDQDAVSVGAGLPAMVVNDNACEPDRRGALESIAGKPAPTGIALSVFPGIA
jgi:hypothetical protein